MAVVNQATEGLAAALRAVGNEDRLTILRALENGGAKAGEVASQLNLSRGAVARHLAVLARAGLVRFDVDSGGTRTYTLNRERSAALNLQLLSYLSPDGGGAAPTVPVEFPSHAEEDPARAPETPEACRVCANAAFVGTLVEKLDRSLDSAQRYQVRLRQMSSQVMSAQEEERKRIARELHDDTAQALTSVLVRLRLLERSVGDGRVGARLEELRDLTGATLEGVRRMAIGLRPPMLDDLGLEAALRAYVEDFSSRWPLQATFQSGDLRRLPPEVELALFRVAQEALSNVAKHAGASRVETRIQRRARTLLMVIKDDGCGFDVETARGSRESGLGLFGMEERLALVGGTLSIDSSSVDGTRVTAEVPVPRGRR